MRKFGLFVAGGAIVAAVVVMYMPALGQRTPIRPVLPDPRRLRAIGRVFRGL